MDIKIIQRIERALRESISEEEATDEAFQDRDFIKKMYSELKRGHSFSWCGRVARLALICRILDVPFDANEMEPDKGY